MERHDSTGRNAYGEDSSAVVNLFRLDPVVVQPLEGADLLQVPAGQRDRERVLVHACQKVRISRGGSTMGADVLLYAPVPGGPTHRYVFETAEPWVAQAGFWRCRAVRLEGDGT